MHNKIVDARGRSCPEPVIMTRNAISGISAKEVVEVLVDAEVAKENVCRFARNNGCSVEIKDLEGEYKIIIMKE